MFYIYMWYSLFSYADEEMSFIFVNAITIPFLLVYYIIVIYAARKSKLILKINLIGLYTFLTNLAGFLTHIALKAD